MKTILNIGYSSYILPDSANVNVILKALSSAVKVDKRFEGRRHVYRMESEAPEITVEMVNNDQIIPLRKTKQIAETASPDAHGKDFFRPEK